MAVKFEIAGPHEIPRTRKPGGWAIERDDIRAFWQSCFKLQDRAGCYIFGMRAGRGIMPYYVGKTAKGFGQEVFQPHKLVHYHRIMMNTSKGTPVFFFAVAEVARGRVNEQAIIACEQHLITLGVNTNPELANKRGTREPAFFIPHVTEPARGRKSGETMAFRRLMGLEGPPVPGGDDISGTAIPSPVASRHPLPSQGERVDVLETKTPVGL